MVKEASICSSSATERVRWNRIWRRKNQQPRNPTATTTVRTIMGGPHGGRKGPSHVCTISPAPIVRNLTRRRTVPQEPTYAFQQLHGKAHAAGALHRHSVSPE